MDKLLIAEKKETALMNKQLGRVAEKKPAKAAVKTTRVWSPLERAAFKTSLEKHGKNFTKINEDIPTKSIKQIKSRIKNLRRVEPAPAKPIARTAPERKPVAKPAVEKPVAKPAVESKPVAKPAAESQPISKPTVESKPAIESKPAAESKPAIEAKPAVESKPVVENKPVVESKPIVENKPVIDQKPVN